jgi:hypothetical protein
VSDRKSPQRDDQAPPPNQLPLPRLATKPKGDKARRAMQRTMFFATPPTDDRSE